MQIKFQKEKIMDEYLDDGCYCEDEHQDSEWSFSDSNHFDEGLDMDQQSPEFWDDLERNADW